MMLFAGLGNPGGRYARNRHNIGIMVLEAIMARHDFAAPRRRFHGLLCRGTLDGIGVAAFRPSVHMNESGRAVGEVMRFFRLSVDALVVFHDELDLPAGKVRVKTGGGLAGHNGLKSLAAHVGGGFHRVRLGIGHPGQRERVIGHVLGDFAKADEAWLSPLLDAVSAAAPLLAQGRDQTFANRVHLALASGALASGARASEG